MGSDIEVEFLKDLNKIGHADGVSSVAVSQDGSTIISGSWDCTVRIWKKSEEEWLLDNTLLGYTKSVKGVILSLDGDTIASWADENTIRIWHNTPNGWQEHKLIGHTHRVCSFAMIPNGSMVVSGSLDSTVRVWRRVMEGWELEQTLEGSTGWIHALTVTADGTTIFSGSNDCHIRVWQKNGKVWELVQLLSGHTGRIISLSLSPDDRTLISGSGGEDPTLRVWKLADEQWHLEETLSGHTDHVSTIAVSENGDVIISGSYSDHTARIWYYQGGKWNCQDLSGYNFPVTSVAATSDGSILVVCWSAQTSNQTSSICIWKREETEWALAQTITEHNSGSTSVKIAKNATWIISGLNDNAIGVWCLHDDKWALEAFLSGTKGRINASTISRDGNIVALGSEKNSICIWKRMGDIWEREILSGFNYQVNAVAITPDGKKIVSGLDRYMRVWICDNETWNYQEFYQIDKLEELMGHISPWMRPTVESIAISFSGSMITTGSRDCKLRIWEYIQDQWQLTATLEGHSNPISTVCIDINERIIVTGSSDKTVRVWAYHEGEWHLQQTLEGHTEWVEAVAVSNDGTMIISGAVDKTVRIWRRIPNTLEYDLNSVTLDFGERVTTIVFSEDENYFFVAGKSKCIAWFVRSIGKNLECWNINLPLIQSLQPFKGSTVLFTRHLGDWGLIRIT
ncbi:MAG: WD40 repeat domain-containing protein [Candidatus Hodarchaeota archaeon]